MGVRRAGRWATRKPANNVLNENTMNSGVTLESHRKKLLSGWLDVWHGLLEVPPVRALDLANHKGEKRNKTHW